MYIYTIFFSAIGIFMFASVIDLVIALECDGFIANFMEFYLKDGEPYLKTAHGTLISYWDGVAHYAMYLMILAAQSWKYVFKFNLFSQVNHFQGHT